MGVLDWFRRPKKKQEETSMNIKEVEQESKKDFNEQYLSFKQIRDERARLSQQSRFGYVSSEEAKLNEEMLKQAQSYEYQYHIPQSRREIYGPGADSPPLTAEDMKSRAEIFRENVKKTLISNITRDIKTSAALGKTEYILNVGQELKEYAISTLKDKGFTIEDAGNPQGTIKISW